MELRFYNDILWFTRGIYHPKRSLRKNSYEIFSKKCKTNPIFLHFSSKNDDFTKKQTQFKPNSKPILGQKQGSIMRTNPIQTQTKPNEVKQKGP